MAYQEVEFDVPEQEENIVVLNKDKAERYEQVAVTRGYLKVNNPVVKITKSGERYIDHPLYSWPDTYHKQRFVSSNSNCKCHERTYLKVTDNYFHCDKCDAIHHVSCSESMFSGLEDNDFITQKSWTNPGWDALEVMCYTCYLKELIDRSKEGVVKVYRNHMNDSDNSST